MKKLITSFLILFCQFVSADPADELSEILKKSISFQGNFHQRVVDDDGFLIEEAEGKVFFKKPHYFKWLYAIPHKNEIIGDGDLIYIYDPDLAQVIISKFNPSENINPASIFFENDLNKFFNVTTIDLNGETWFQCDAIKDDLGYESVQLKFNEVGIISGMKIVDSLKNTVSLKFSQIKNNTNIDDASFMFNVPENVEVIKN